MGSCAKLMLKNVPDDMPDWIIDCNGLVWLDLPNDFDWNRGKGVERFILDTLTGEGVLGFSLPDTKRNRVVLGNYGSLTAKYFDQRTLIEVVAWNGSTILRQNTLSIVRKQNADGTWECDLIDGSIYWKDALESISLNDLELGIFEWTWPVLQDVWANDAKYDDTNRGYWAPLVHYGAWRDMTGTGVTPADFRPLVHILKIMQDIFCLAGFKFRSPILETDWGRRLIAYELRDLSSIGEDSFGFRATNAAAINIVDIAPGPAAWTFIPDDDTSTGMYDDLEEAGDPVGFLDVLDGKAKNLSGIYEFVINFTFFSNEFCNVEIDIFSEAPFQQIGGSGILIYDTPGEDKNFSVTIPIVVGVAPTQTVIFTGQTNLLPAGHGTIIRGGYTIEMRTLEVDLQDGSKYPLGKLLEPDTNSLEFAAGVAHLINGRFVTDTLKREVWLYQPETKEIYEEGRVEGFYQPREKAIVAGQEEIILCDQDIREIRTGIDRRKYRLAFAKGDDQLLDDRGTEDTKWSRLIDFGANKGYLDDTEEERNPHFEPTDNYQADDFSDYPGWTNETALVIPAMWDNDDGEISYQIGPRILYAIEYVEQDLGIGPGGIGYTKRNWPTQSAIIEQFPWATQYTELSHSDGTAVEQSVVYGAAPDDLYTTSWQESIRELEASLGVQIDMYMDDCFYEKQNGRDIWRVCLKGEWAYLKLVALIDRIGCGKAPTTAELIIADSCFTRRTNTLDNLCFMEIQGEYDSAASASGGGVLTDEYYQLTQINDFAQPGATVMQLNPTVSFANDAEAIAAFGPGDFCYALSQINDFAYGEGTMRFISITVTTYLSDAEAAADGIALNRPYVLAQGNIFYFNAFFIKVRMS